MERLYRGIPRCSLPKAQGEFFSEYIFALYSSISTTQHLREWMSNNRCKALGLASLETSVESLLSSASANKGGHGHQLCEIFQCLNRDMINSAVEEELLKFPNPNCIPSKRKGEPGEAVQRCNPTGANPNAPKVMTDRAYKMKV